MHSRRKFLLQGSFATTALLVTKPFTTIANSLAPVTGFSINNNKLVLVHTGNCKALHYSRAVHEIATLKQHTNNLLVLHAGDVKPPGNGQTAYDASMHTGEKYSVTGGDYKIIYKGDIKTGVITASDSGTVSFSRINTIATYLKNEKNCGLVICLSQLGFRSKDNIDDQALAAASTHIDIIIGGHAKNFCKQPFTAKNKNKEEVIINHTAGNALALRKIEIAFDDNGRKHSVSFTRTVTADNALNKAANI